MRNYILNTKNYRLEIKRRIIIFWTKIDSKTWKRERSFPMTAKGLENALSYQAQVKEEENHYRRLERRRLTS